VRSSASAAAIGFSVHTGWAASVSVAGPLRAPRIVDRRRIQLSDSDDTVRAEVYHRAAQLSGTAAATFVREAEDAAARRARAAVESLRDSQPLFAAGILMSAGAGKLPPDLAAILRSHPLIHTAEGVLYREALATAAEAAHADDVVAEIRDTRVKVEDRTVSAARVVAAIGVVSTLVQGVANLPPAYQVFKAALAAVGITGLP